MDNIYSTMIQIPEWWIIAALLIVIVYLYWTGKLVIKQGFNYLKHHFNFPMRRHYAGYWVDSGASAALMRKKSPVMTSYI